jgi:hypothetical protein
VAGGTRANYPNKFSYNLRSTREHALAALLFASQGWIRRGLHGSVFEFVRNSAFDMRNYFDHVMLAYMMGVGKFPKG